VCVTAVAGLAGLAVAMTPVAPAVGQVSAGRGPDVPTSESVSRQAPARVSVTLLTGDRVVLPSATATSAGIVPGPGRHGTRFLTRVVDGHLYVIPLDALPLLRQGVLDRRLFDVTGLVEAGYDDRRQGAVPLIVAYGSDTARTRGRGHLAEAGGTDLRSLPVIDATALEVAKDSATSFWNDLVVERNGVARTFAAGIEKVWLDGKRRLALDQSVPQIGAPAAWDAGYRGEGVTVAVVDGGIDATHPDLDGKVKAAKDFTGEGLGDDFGHGTHVASTIAGTGAASDGTYTGVAPEASLLDAKVCGRDGFCDESAIVAGMEWAAVEQQADILNLSLGGADTPEVDPLEEAVNRLSEETGALFVISAGNSGPEEESVESPGSADAALTVGAVDKSDELAFFSSRGPRVGDGAIKPDVTAPGVEIVAARAAGTEMGPPVGDHYVSADGTSMAAPHVAGAAALLAQQHPEWTGEQLKRVLVASAVPHPDVTVLEQGAGRVDVSRALTQTVTTDPVSLSFGRAEWPHEDDEPVTKTVTYHNSGSSDVTLELAVTLTGPDGEPAPASAVELSQTSLTVPAGGSASVDITSHTAHDGPDGFYSGRLTATAEGVSVATPIGVNKEVESYDLTIEYLDRGGQPTNDADSMILGLDASVWEFTEVVDGRTRIRLPAGRYLVDTMVFDEDEGELTLLVQPVLTLDRDQTIIADSRLGKPLSTTVERPSVRPAMVTVGYDVRTDHIQGSSTLGSDTFDGLYTAHLGPAASGEMFSAHVTSQWAVPGPEGDFANSPYLYGLVDTQDGRYYTGFDRTVRDRDLATVRTRIARQLPDRQAMRFAFGVAESMSGGIIPGLVMDLPHTVTSYLEPASVTWSFDVEEFVRDEEGWPVPQTTLWSEDRQYRKGHRYVEQWNDAVFAPVTGSASFVERDGDAISVGIPMYGDGSGHAGESLTDTARTTLYRDGRKVAETEYPGYLDTVTVPVEESTYQLKVSATRPSYSLFSTEVETTWTFRSKHVEEPTPLPLWAVRFDPKVDQTNRGKRATVVPIKLQAQDGAKVGVIRRLSVSVSTDDGRSWRPVRAVRVGKDRWVAAVAVVKDRDASYVSLRAKASDTRGNKVEQTIIRAYAVR